MSPALLHEEELDELGRSVTPRLLGVTPRGGIGSVAARPWE